MATEELRWKRFYENTKLILPTREYFPSKVEDENEAAIVTFAAVKKYAGMEEWPCKRQAQEEDIETRVAPTTTIQNVPNNFLGTFGVVETNETVITYKKRYINEG